MLNRRDFLHLAAATALTPSPTRISLTTLKSPILFPGDATHAFRDPAAYFFNNTIYLFFTLVLTEPDGTPYSYVASSQSRDLRTWTTPVRLTPRGTNLNFSSPGDIVRDGPHFLLCFQSYPRPHREKYGNQDARIWTMSSRDLEHWGLPILLRVKGPRVSREDMGRMIDPFLFADKDSPKDPPPPRTPPKTPPPPPPARKWYCLYKQNGLSLSTSPDLDTWTPLGTIDAGENPCIITDRNEYVLFHSPPNGIGVKRSPDLTHWRDEPTLTLGQKEWPWAQGRLTAAFVLDLRQEPTVGKALMFFHGSMYAESDPRGGFDNYASIGLAWSDDLHHWQWPKTK